jgi:hypothetical protein
MTHLNASPSYDEFYTYHIRLTLQCGQFEVDSVIEGDAAQGEIFAAAAQQAVDKVLQV